MAMIDHSELFNSMFDEKTFSNWAEFQEKFESFRELTSSRKEHSYLDLDKRLVDLDLRFIHVIQT